jgi:transposase
MSSLFETLPEQPVPPSPARAGARVRAPERDQLILCPGSLDDLLAGDHLARTVVAFVAQMDLSALYAAIRAREGAPGHPPPDPRLLVALWLYATIDGVGSARELARLCDTHIAYQWLCGGVSTNHHTLSDFRVLHGEWVDAALSCSIAALLAAGVISLSRTAQDGLRVRAAAGSASFRRQASLQTHLAAAEQQVQTLKRELEQTPEASRNRKQAADLRAAAEREARLKAALAALPAAEARTVRNKGKRENARVSSTDPEATVMKMPGGGFRPAYNTQLAAETGHGLVVGTDVTDTGADQPSLVPMVEQIEARFGQRPDDHLVDGGYAGRDGITQLARQGVKVYAPPRQTKTGEQGAAKPDDTPELIEWRQRMATDEAKTIYRQRAATIEWVNAGYRNRGFRQVAVRGLHKVRVIVGWQALAHNLLCILRHKALAEVFRLPVPDPVMA